MRMQLAIDFGTSYTYVYFKYYSDGQNPEDISWMDSSTFVAEYAQTGGGGIPTVVSSEKVNGKYLIGEQLYKYCETNPLADYMGKGKNDGFKTLLRTSEGKNPNAKIAAIHFFTTFFYSLISNIEAERKVRIDRIDKIVIGCPAIGGTNGDCTRFSYKKVIRNILYRSLKEAEPSIIVGRNNIRVVVEPALVAQIINDKRNANDGCDILVVDVGYGTTDICYLPFRNGQLNRQHIMPCQGGGSPAGKTIDADLRTNLGKVDNQWLTANAVYLDEIKRDLFFRYRRNEYIAETRRRPFDQDSLVFSTAKEKDTVWIEEVIGEGITRIADQVFNLFKALLDSDNSNYIQNKKIKIFFTGGSTRIYPLRQRIRNKLAEGCGKQFTERQIQISEDTEFISEFELSADKRYGSFLITCANAIANGACLYTESNERFDIDPVIDFKVVPGGTNGNRLEKKLKRFQAGQTDYLQMRFQVNRESNITEAMWFDDVNLQTWRTRNDGIKGEYNFRNGKAVIEFSILLDDYRLPASNNKSYFIPENLCDGRAHLCVIMVMVDRNDNVHLLFIPFNEDGVENFQYKVRDGNYEIYFNDNKIRTVFAIPEGDGILGTYYVSTEDEGEELLKNVWTQASNIPTEFEQEGIKIRIKKTCNG